MIKGNVSFSDLSYLIKLFISVNQYEDESFISSSDESNSGSDESFCSSNGSLQSPLESYGGPIDRNLDPFYLSEVLANSWPILISPKSRTGYTKVHLRSYSSDSRSSSGDSIPNQKVISDIEIERFWEEVYSEIHSRAENVSLSETSKSQKGVMYALDKFRNRYHKIQKNIKHASCPLNDKLKYKNELFYFQETLEWNTMCFSVDNVYSQARPLMNKLTCNSTNEPVQPARDYLKGKACGLDADELKALNDTYHNIHTIEAIIVHVFAILFSKNIFSNEPQVKLVTLIQHLDDAIRDQFRLGQSNKKTIGRNLISYLVDREFISIVSMEVPLKKTHHQNHPKKVKHSYVECLFNLKSLPLKLNLPMIVPPKKWIVNSKHLQEGNNIKLNELEEGGYLTVSKDKTYNRFSLLASRDTDNFNIIIKDVPGLCSILNNLQSKAFRINETMLDFILDNRSLLEKADLLMDSRIAHVKMSDAYPVLRNLYYNNIAARNQYLNISDLELEFSKRVQQARFEDFILDLAKAYRGYEFYLPAFLDFRGRIYRTGLLHFHERDIAKSLILFSNQMENQPLYKDLNPYYSAAVAFKYKKHDNYNNAYIWYKDNVFSNIYQNDKDLIEFSKKASDPFQFLSKVLIHKENDFLNRYSEVPISQDASASAYQIMSYFQLNQMLAQLTNLFPNQNPETNEDIIQDIYLMLHKVLCNYLKKEIPDLFPLIESRFNRKLVKSLFMPMIYGKTVVSMTEDIYSDYSNILNYKDCSLLASSCWKYFKENFPDIISFMKMINNIGSICAYTEKPVIYETDYFMTVQDYMKYDSESLTVKVYKKSSTPKGKDRKRPDVRKVTFRFPTTKRDLRKTGIATCVNFIHQKDAYIAMIMISKVLKNYQNKSTIYTVHDNFITPMSNSFFLPKFYNEIFLYNLPHPLILVNHFILINMRADLSKYSLAKPIHNLKELIMNQVNKNHKKVKTIEKKVDETVKLYIDYVDRITKPNLYYNYKKRLKDDWSLYALHF